MDRITRFAGHLGDSASFAGAERRKDEHRIHDRPGDSEDDSIRRRDRGLDAAIVSADTLLTEITDADRARYAKVEQLTSALPDRTKDFPMDSIIHSPLEIMSRQDCLTRFNKSFKAGKNMIANERYIKALCGSHGGNICYPMVVTPLRGTPRMDWLVTIGHPDDASRLARAHLKKSDLYGVAFLGDGVLSTKDMELWKEQRTELIDAFLPYSSLEKIYPVSKARAIHAVMTRIPSLLDENNVLEVNEFFLHEAMAQLQMTLLGETQEYMEELNVPLREAFTAAFQPLDDPMEALKVRRASRKYVQSWANRVVERATDAQGNPRHEGPENGHPHGPLAARIATLCPHAERASKIRRDAASTFLFAGHDTTANLMTWCTYELCRNPQYQDRLRDELHALVRKHGELTYRSFQDAPFFSRVIAETLRMWPSVPNGTFRELQHDDVVVGRDGKLVTLPKGTQINIPPWLLHTNPDLWVDPEVFNPDRDFHPSEIFYGEAFNGIATSSERFFPFTTAKRDCIGRNFAHMEARIILGTMLLNYRVELAEPTKSLEPTARVRDEDVFLAKNNATMSPVDGIYVKFVPIQ